MFQPSRLMFSILFSALKLMANEGSEAAAPAGTNVTYEDKVQQDRTKEWMDVVSSLSASKTKIKAKEDTIKDIIHHKQKAKTKGEAEALVAELLREHKELLKLTDDYNTSAQLLRYRYPDVGLTEKRKYEKLEMKSLDEFEDAQTIEGQLKKTVSKLKTHYGVKDEKKTNVEPVKKPGFDYNNLAQPKILKK